MEIRNINSTTNFNGYRNLMTNSAKVSKKEGFTFLSMQLNNLKKNDLEIWQSIQRNLFFNNKPSDVFTVEHLNGFGNEMLLLGDRGIDPNVYPKQSEKEMLLMKAYTWMADLTKRIMNDNALIKDNGQFNVFHKTIANILPLFNGNKILAGEFVLMSHHPDNHPQPAALEINKAIEKIMFDYLL